MKLRNTAAAFLVFLAVGCASTAPQPQQTPQALQGIASWYGQEFAGRTTANGEIFDPMQFTAAHRTLPFGTVVEVKNRKTSQAVQVRINDRGPYVGNRIIDLSYAAAQQIGLIEPGTGEVEIAVVKMGRGELEPPAPYVVDIVEPAQKIAVGSGEPPRVDFPLPSGRTATPAEDLTVDSVQVVEERQGVRTRRQVAADGRTIENVAVDEEAAVMIPSAPGHTAAERLDREQRPVAAPAQRSAQASAASQHYVQLGAFAVEANARALADRVTRIGQTATVSLADGLHRVRIGPFPTRDEAVRARTALEANGMSAMIVRE